MIEIVSASRMTQEEFWQKSALGISLQRLFSEGRIFANIFYQNSKGLPDIYNERIKSKNAGDILIFIHDDVWIDDFFLIDHVIAGVEKYDIIGVAGNRRRVKNQPGWAFVNADCKWDDPRNLSGSIAHGQRPFGKISYFGPVDNSCELLDGVFLASKKITLKTNEVFFDPQFSFHFYDLDFCRTAKEKGLSLGTYPIALTHQSGGNFKSAQWQEKYQLYLDKWEK